MKNVIREVKIIKLVLQQLVSTVSTLLRVVKKNVKTLRDVNFGAIIVRIMLVFF